MRIGILILIYLISLNLYSADAIVKHPSESHPQENSPRYKEKCPFCNPERCKMTKYLDSEIVMQLKILIQLHQGTF
jgi:hypothetical protein